MRSLVQVADCPVYVSLAEAEAFARWAGGRVMTEEEYAAVVQHKELQGLLSSVAAEADEQATAHCLESGGWEWTSTPFKPFQGEAGWQEGSRGHAMMKGQRKYMILKDGC